MKTLRIKMKNNRWILGLIVIVILVAGFMVLDYKGLMKQDTQSNTDLTLSLENLKNASYELEGRQFKLINGVYADKTDKNDPFYAFFEPVTIAYNNSNSAQADKAGVIVSIGHGGTGRFVHLVLMGIKDNEPEYISDDLIDDRAVINSVTFADDKITVSAIVHGSNDPMCCPTLEKTLTYNLTADNKLEKQNCSEPVTVDKAIENVNNLQEVKDWYALDGPYKDGTGEDKSVTGIDKDYKSDEFFKVYVVTNHIGAGTFMPFRDYKVEKCSGKIICNDKDENCF